MDIDLKKHDVNNISSSLKECVSILSTYKKQYENISIKISQELPKIENQIDKNISSSEELTNMLTSSGVNSESPNIHYELINFNEQLNTVVNTLRESKDDDTVIFNQLRSTIDISILSLAKIRDIDNISENLKVFAINSIVYAQRAGNSGRGYQLISGQFIKLSEDLSKSTVNIMNSGKKLNSFIIDLLEKIESHDHYNTEHIEYITKESRNLIDNSNDTITKLSSILENIIENIKKIKEPTYLIMMHMQKQDIIQQQIEHIFDVVSTMEDIMIQNKAIIESEDFTSPVFLDIFTLLNFILITTEDQFNRINDDIQKMIHEIENPMNIIVNTISKIQEYGNNITNNSNKLASLDSISEMINSVFLSPQVIISDIVDKLSLNQTQKKNLLFIYKNISEMMEIENDLAQDFIPLMNMIQNLLFLAKVEQARNQLDISLDLDNKNSFFSNIVFEEMNNIVNGISNSYEIVSQNVINIIDSFAKQDSKYDFIRENLKESLKFLTKTQKLFTTNYNSNIEILKILGQEVIEYKNDFNNLKFLQNDMSIKFIIFTQLKEEVAMKLQSIGGALNLNECSYRHSIIQKIIDNLTVDDERRSILDQFPELEIEETTGSAITLF